MSQSNPSNPNPSTPPPPVPPDVVGGELLEFEVIHAYSRAEAIADGVLVDVSEWASVREMSPGFTCPVAFTAALWAAVESIPARYVGVQDVRGRAHDVLWLGALSVRALSKRREPVGQYRVQLAVVGSRRRVHRLQVEFNPAEGVTIGFPEDF